jgi:glycosyltransferase involved in cell wall biosynthesis
MTVEERSVALDVAEHSDEPASGGGAAPLPSERIVEATRPCPKVAWLSPFPPQHSGIANYSQRLVRALKSRFEIDLYYQGEKPSPELLDEFASYPISHFIEQREHYDEVVYHLGNNSMFHKRIYELAWQFPGTLVLHDYNLSAFMHEAFFKAGSPLYAAALREGYVARGRTELLRVTSRRAPDSNRFPMSHAIVKRSRKVIVHHRWTRNQFADHPHAEVIPHFAQINYTPTARDVARFRHKLGLKDDHFLITCLGFVNLNKLPGLQIQVTKQLLKAGYPVQLVFAGEPAPEVLDLLVQSKLDGLGQHIICTGFLEEHEYFSAIFASDIVINLRNPTMGESSGTLAHALAAGRPTIVTDINQYQEFPDEICWKLVHDEKEAELLFEYLRTLLANPSVRAALGRNASQYAEDVLSLEAVSARWAQSLRNYAGR